MPEQRRKTHRLPRERGIRKIEMDSAEAPGEAEIAPVGQMRIDLSEADRALLGQIRERLETQCGEPVSNSQVIRWAVWHCRWDDGKGKGGDGR